METVERPFAAAKRQAAIGHVLTATRRLAVARGLDITMEQIAEASGVSRRTLFRLFDSRERLIGAAFAAGMANYEHDLPAYKGDLEHWLRATCEAAHRMNASFGPGYWELTSRTDLPPDLAETEQKRRQDRRSAMSRISCTLWQAAGGTGEMPDALSAAGGAHLSAHFTAAVVTDVGHPWQTAADLAHDAILTALRRQMEVALEARRATGRPSGTARASL